MKNASSKFFLWLFFWFLLLVYLPFLPLLSRRLSFENISPVSCSLISLALGVSGPFSNLNENISYSYFKQYEKQLTSKVLQFHTHNFSGTVATIYTLRIYVEAKKKKLHTKNVALLKLQFLSLLLCHSMQNSISTCPNKAKCSGFIAQYLQWQFTHVDFNIFPLPSDDFNELNQHHPSYTFNFVLYICRFVYVCVCVCFFLCFHTHTHIVPAKWNRKW